MNTRHFHVFLPRNRHAQRGAVLMITLISLVILLLAAISLFRSVDTGTLIAGNLALRQAAVAAGDRAVAEAAAAIKARQDSSAENVWTFPTHPLNTTDAAISYYTHIDPDLDLMAASTWAAGGPSTDLNAEDGGGNRTQYLIQRMCRQINTLPESDYCVLNYIDQDNDSKATGAGVPDRPKFSIMYRVTVRVSGPKNTVSFTQAFIN